MRIEELVLDGFKSYPVRTTISGWDASFNAITGLNGSGKSNILDAICFVLGITNLTAVRAANLQDLIYKRGQAGVTRASVTVVFDNSDRSKSPMGFESCKQVVVTRQVAMGGVSKYLINGHRATQQQVQNLFSSVQLNINNPNFLIMQGKITKVLNMKPPEILGLIEEAAGTSMFEERKGKALRTMERKQKKMEEIQELLNDEITPKLDRLREEKRTYIEFQKASSELETLKRLVVAFDWVDLNGKHVRYLEKAQDKANHVQRLRSEATRMESEVAKMAHEFEIISKKRDKESAQGGKLQKLEDRVKELLTELARLKTKLALKAGSLQEEENKVADLDAHAADIRSQREVRKKQNDDDSQRFTVAKAAHEEAAASLLESEALLQTLITGVSSARGDDATSSGYMGQLASAKAKAASLSTEAEQAKLRMEHLEKELKQKEPRAMKASKEGQGLLGELERMRKEKSRLESQLLAGTNDASTFDALILKRDELQTAIRELSAKRDEAKSGLGRLDFQYADPERNFDRRSVKGLVANLIAIDESNFKASTALEICAGGRLYNVIVDNERVGSQLLEHGRLKQRVTIIPLNQIQAFVAKADTLASAKRLAPGRNDLALDLIGYPDEVATAMKYVFGNTLICADANAAKDLSARSKGVGMKSVTLQGDVYNPSGTLEGGSAPASSQILVNVQALRKLEEALAAKTGELAKVTTQLDDMSGAMERHKKARKALDLHTHEVALLESRVSESNATRIVSEVEQIKSKMSELKDTIANCKVQQKQVDTDCARIEKEMKDFANNRDSKLNELKATIKAKKAEVAKQNKSWQTIQREQQTAKLELDQFESDIKAAQTGVADARENLAKLKIEHKELEAEYEAQQFEHEQTSAQLKDEKKQLTAFDTELKELEAVMKRKRDDIGKAEADEKVVEAERESAVKEAKNSAQIVKALEKQYDWIHEEKGSFGKPDTPYDFTNARMADVKKKCRDLEERHQGMRKKVNPKVLTMIDNVEKKERELMKMYAQVQKDKAKIEETIAKLDDYKRSALSTTWGKVNGDFGQIFGELLPGNFCKLQPPEDMDITQGLEVKVRLGQVWKQSLTELSGGQRSLIALSLIMSLLQFKPAPMYILDEVDAALDLSHTQHIGHLFRTRFKGSQFIVVSLKEGLFTNANVLFRARFRDGTSVVERTASRSANAETRALYEDERHSTGRKASGQVRQRPPLTEVTA